MLLLIFAFIMPVDQPTDKHWISRCFELAKRGIGYVSPNPPVGAVLVYQNKILGEGYHSFFGGPHAEVEAFKSVANDDRKFIPEAILYVSLEPCCIYSKTPPCTDLIIREGVKDVRISTHDPNPKIAGKGIETLKAQGVNVTCGILEEEGKELIKAFTKNILYQKPYVILKWAQSIHGFMGMPDQRIMISHSYTTAWSHQLRSASDAIIVGAHTVIIDNPKLTTRDSPGRSPHRVVYDPNATLHSSYFIFGKDDRSVFYFSKTKNPEIRKDHIIQYHFNEGASHIDQMMSFLFSHQVGILLVEGGSFLLDLFIKENQWDEAWVIRSKHHLNAGVPAPQVKGKLIGQFDVASDTVVGIGNEQ